MQQNILQIFKKGNILQKCSFLILGADCINLKFEEYVEFWVPLVEIYAVFEEFIFCCKFYRGNQNRNFMNRERGSPF